MKKYDWCIWRRERERGLAKTEDADRKRENDMMKGAWGGGS